MIRLDIDSLGVSFVATDMVDETIVRDPIKKGRKLRSWPVILPRLDDLPPNILKNVLGGVAVVTEPQQIAIEGIIVALVKHLERRDIAIAVTQHQGAVFRRFVHFQSIGDSGRSGNPKFRVGH